MSLRTSCRRAPNPAYPATAIIGNKKSKFPKRIPLNCPYCGHTQDEPEKAVSTFCRGCGQHYRIEAGQPLASPGQSGITPIRTRKVEDFTEGSAGSSCSYSPASSSPASSPATSRSGGGPGFFSALASRLKPTFHPGSGSGAATQARNKSSSKAPSGPEKRPVRCFACGRVQQVSTVATSTQCGRCSVYISLADHDVRMPLTQNIKTRGDVVIQKKGSLIGYDIACHNLLVIGRISGSVDCSGNAIFRNSAKIMGSMHCKHLTIDKSHEVQFPQGVVAESADIHGTLNGNIVCTGPINIFKTGAVLGDATARTVMVQDGGTLTGKMTIQQNLEIAVPEKSGRRRSECPSSDSSSADQSARNHDDDAGLGGVIPVTSA